MTLLLKQSTAATVVLGPFVDSTDGVTAETGLTISQADVRLSKNGGAFAQKNDANAATHMENGYYSCALNTTDTGTLGRLRAAVNESGALPVWQDFMVVPANVYDSLVGGSDNLQVHAAEISAGLITATALADNAITAAKIAADAIGASELATDAVSEIQSGLATAAALATVDSIVDAILVDTGTTIPGLIAALNNLSAAEVNAEMVDVVATDVIADSVPADGSRPTMRQALLMITRFLMEKSVSGTTVTVKKEDGSTASMTFTLDSATSPTSITRAS